MAYLVSSGLKQEIWFHAQFEAPASLREKTWVFDAFITVVGWGLACPNTHYVEDIDKGCRYVHAEVR